jgi:hypothetical protein
MAMAQARVVALALCALLLVSGVARRAEAVSYNVGNSAGWDLSADLPSWADGKTFNVGDVLGKNLGWSPSLATSSPAVCVSRSVHRSRSLSRAVQVLFPLPPFDREPKRKRSP